jgi:hypothetical protein
MDGRMTVWQTIRSYFLWTHTRGSIHYDVMVTVILLFIFLTPLWVDFKDKPVERSLHQSRVVVTPAGQDESSFIVEVDAGAISGESDEAIRAGLMRVIEPIAGEVRLVRYETVPDRQGRTVKYKAWVTRKL